MILQSKVKYKRGISSPNGKHLELDASAEVGSALPVFSGPTAERTYTLPDQAQNIVTGDSNGGVFTAQTTDGTIANIHTFTLGDSKITAVEVHVSGERSDELAGAHYVKIASFRRTGTTVVKISETTVASHTEAGTSDAWGGLTIDNSSTTCRIRVTGATSQTINWRAFVIVRTAG